MKNANEFYIDIGTMNELFAAQATLEGRVQVYNTVQASGNSLNIQNLNALMGGENPTTKLATLNSYIDRALSIYEGHIATDQAIVASNRVIVGQNRSEVIQMRAMQEQANQRLAQKQAEAQMLELKLTEEQNIHQLKQSEYINALQQNKEFIESMTLSQRSFVLQKALITSNDAIIELMINVELDPDFRNGDGVSLVQTANEVGNQTIIEKLAPIAAPESSYSPEMTYVVHNMQDAPKISQFQSESQEVKSMLETINEHMANLNTDEESKVDNVEPIGDTPD